MSPPSGRPGTQVVLSGTGFDGACSVSLSDEPAPVLTSSPTELRVAVPPLARSGTFAVTCAEETTTWPEPFTVTRPVTVRVTLPPGASPAGLSVSAGLVPCAPGTDASWTCEVTRDRHLLVLAAGDDTTVALMGVVDADDPGSVTIDAATTAAAQAHAALAALMSDRSPESHADILQAVRESPELATAASLIASDVGARIDWMLDPRVGDAIEDLVLAAAEDLAQPSPGGVAQGAGEPGFTPSPAGTSLRDLDPALPSYPLTLRSKLEVSDDFPRFDLTFGKRKDNPVDWISHLYRLDPAHHSRGLEDIRGLNSPLDIRYLSRSPLRAADTPADSATKYFSPLDWAAGEYAGLVGKTLPGDDPPNALLMPLAPAALYVSHSYSGAGTLLSDMVATLPDGGRNDSGAFYLNAFLSALDIVSGVVGIGELLGEDFLRGAVFSTYKKLFETLGGLAPTDSRDGVVVAQTVLALGVDLAKGIANKLFEILTELGEEGLANAVLRSAAAYGRIFAALFDVLDKAKDLVAGATRLGTLLRPTGFLPVETSVVVVGDPFRPELTRVAPEAVRGGSRMRLEGRRFKTDMVAELCRELIPGGPLGVRVRLARVSGTATSALYEVPPSWVDVPGAGDGGFFFVCVHAGDLVDDSRHLGSAGRVYLTPFPVIESLEPAHVLSRGTLVLRGLNFETGSLGPGIGPSQHVAVIDDDIPVAATSSGAGTITVQLPALLPGTHAVSVRALADLSNAVSFEVIGLPTPNGLLPGATISVTSSTMENVRDDHLSLGEALMLAAGTLGVNELTTSRPCGLNDNCRGVDCSGFSCQQERSRVLLPEEGAIGAGHADLIQLGGGRVALTEPLVIASGDRLVTFAQSLTLDASALPASRGALELEDIHDFVVDAVGFGPGMRALVIENAAGPAVHVTGMTTNCTLSGLVVRNCGWGLRASGSASGLTVNQITIDQADLAGIELVGDTHDFVFNQPVVGASGTGIRLAERATRHRFDYPVVDDSVADGIRLEDEAHANILDHPVVRGSGRDGIVLSGTGVAANSVLDDVRINAPPYDGVRRSGRHGVLVEAGAHDNVLSPKAASENGADGIRLEGAGANNVVELVGAWGNVGDGIFVGPGVTGTSVFDCTVAGNGRDGVRMQGCFDTEVDGLVTGIDQFHGYAPEDLSNAGSGIHLLGGALGNLVGRATPVTDGTASEGSINSRPRRNVLGGNEAHGIHLEGAGTSFNRVNHASVGMTMYGRFETTAAVPNGMDGIRIDGGASENVVGDANELLAVRVHGAPGAGVAILGEGTDENLVIGCLIGATSSGSQAAALRLGTGVRIADRARGNVIGLPGERITGPDPATTRDVWSTTSNWIGNVTGAAVEIDDAGLDPAAPDPADANVLTNNTIGRDLSLGGFWPVARGIVVSGESYGNVIGGIHPGAGNRIAQASESLLALRDIRIPDVPSSSELVGVVAGNELGGAGPPFSPQDPCSETGAAIVVAGCEGLVVGEPGAPNTVQFAATGALVSSSADCTLRALDIRDVWGPGIALCDSTEINVGDPGEGAVITVQVVGSSRDDDAGVVIRRGGANSVRHCVVGDDGLGTGTGIAGWGIAVIDSPGNVLGGAGHAEANVIARSSSGGIRVTGAASTGNRIQSCLVGTDLAARELGVAGPGIRVDGMASGTTIGGEGPLPVAARAIASVPAWNRITRSLGAGVEIVGPSAMPTTVLSNSITANLGKGISLVSGGNGAIPAPFAMAFDGTTLSGQVAMDVPGGSLVQVFGDPAGEGDTLLAEARVDAQHRFRLENAVLPRGGQAFTATVTHAVTGATSEFSDPLAIPRVVDVGRADETQDPPPGIPGDGVVVALALELEANELDAEAWQIEPCLSGTLDDLEKPETLEAWWDVDGNQAPSAPDLLLDTQMPSADDACVPLSLRGLRLSDGGSATVLVVAHVPADAPLGATFQLSVPDAGAFDLRLMQPLSGMAHVAGGFPIVGPQLVVVGDAGDADRDGIVDASDNCDASANSTQLDSDGDGVGDACEPCRFDAAKREPGACGCGASDGDADLDGAPDCRDACPADPMRILAGACGCGADTDSDVDGVPDCIDTCPRTATPDQTDADGDGAGAPCDAEIRVALGADDEPGPAIRLPILVQAGSSAPSHVQLMLAFDPMRVTLDGVRDAMPGCVLLLAPEHDGSALLTVDCAPQESACSPLVGLQRAGRLEVTLAMNEPTLLACGAPSSRDCDGLSLETTCAGTHAGVECVVGDVAPPPSGNGVIDLDDFVGVRDWVTGRSSPGPGVAPCADIHPGTATCTAGEVTNWCSVPDGHVRIGDLLTLRREIGEMVRLSCAACGMRIASVSFVAGDIAPAGAPDARVDIADVVRALRLAIGLELDAVAQLVADVAPMSGDGASGDGRVDIADVVMMLRAAVGLEHLAWAEREAVIAPDWPVGARAGQIRITGLPPGSSVRLIDAVGCDGFAEGLDLSEAGTSCVITCVEDDGEILSTAPPLRLGLRGPRPPDGANPTVTGVTLGPRGMEPLAVRLE